MLEVSGLVTGYNKMPVLHGLDFKVNKGEIVALLGTNGVGKTTTFLTVAGLLKPWNGKITFEDKEITNLPAYETVKLGISLVPEGRLLFGKLTVQENILMGGYTRKDEIEKKERLEQIYDIFPRVKERLKQKAETLSGGEQQMVAIARGLMSNPSLLLLDEPSLGLMPKLVKEVFEFVKKINEMGITVIIVEQNVKETLSIADRAYVIQEGKIELEGSGQELIDNPEIKRVYLGM